MRTQITTDPFIVPKVTGEGQSVMDPDFAQGFLQEGLWPAYWIADPQAHGPAVIAFRKRFTLAQPAKVRFHISADERYEWYLDGERMGRGPERGDAENWFYETYDLELKPGEHVIVARTWRLGELAPVAQMSVRSAFLFAAEGISARELNTGIAQWECKRVDGYEWLPQTQMRGYYACGARFRIDGRAYPWNIERGDGDLWRQAEKVLRACNAASINNYELGWRLRPAMLPAMLDEPRSVGRCAHVERHAPENNAANAVLAANNLAGEAAQWNDLVRAKKPVVVPANTSRRIIIDLDNYYCGYSEARVSGGAGATLAVGWSEALFEKTGGWEKGNRDQIDGKFITSCGDVFVADGGAGRTFEPLWWQAGRYLEVTVRTADEPLTIELLRVRETRYPHRFSATFASDDARLAAVIPIALRTIEMCSHETYMDCPHYEQLMYVGDTRLHVLTTYAASADDLLPRKALRMFDASRITSGLTQSRYPSNTRQMIPPFSLWWIAMVHDFAQWRDDRAFLLSLLPGVRAVIDGIKATLTEGNLLSAPNGWNFMDWVPAWYAGVPPDGIIGITGLINWQFVLVLKQVAELEDIAGEPELAARCRRLASSIANAAAAALWDEQRGLFADDLAKKNFSEHTQCLALLSGHVAEPRRQRVAAGLLSDKDLHRTTIYFTHYLFETYRLLDRVDLILQRMPLWFDHHKVGMKTTMEMPEPTRSDCHAWGAYPVYHYFATIIGIRPAKPGFGEVRIEPRLGALQWAEGTMPHPRGVIEARVENRAGTLRATISLPVGVSGILVWGASEIALKAGKQNVEIPGDAAASRGRG
jgi:alpha-L-rhamnosidase